MAPTKVVVGGLSAAVRGRRGGGGVSLIVVVGVVF